ncbi:hypothetical protein C6501_07945 [Candidatus Poribacteria bacterium]|nr:MAG: hypothetical protein C6501_07945 [Candidatus Poribacteria bacterium]
MERATHVVERLKGPVVPVNTCFGDDDSLDIGAMRKYVNWLCEQSVPVILLTYGSSEFCSLTDEEIWRLTSELAEEISGRSLFIPSTGWWHPGQCREFLKHCNGEGVDAVKVQIHPGLGLKREVIVGYFDGIQDAAPMPLLVWGAWQDPYPVDIVVELAKRPEVVGIKNDGHPFYAYYDIIRATTDENFAVVSGGQMRNFMFGYPIGSTAYLCTIAPFRPDIALEFYNALTTGHNDDAKEIVFRYEEPWLKTATKLEWLPSIKSALHLHGLYPNHRLRTPAISHTDEKHQEVRGVLERIFGNIKFAEL